MKKLTTFLIPALVMVPSMACDAVAEPGLNTRGNSAPQRPDYARFWADKIKPSKGEFFLHSTYQPRVEVSPIYAAKIKETAESELRNAERDGSVNPDPTKTLDISYHTTHGYTGSTMSEEVLKAYSERASDGFKQFLEYVGRPDLVPKMEFRLLDKETEFAAPTWESAVMYLVWNRNIYAEVRYHYRGEKASILRKGIRLDDSIMGQLVGRYTSVFDKEKGIQMKFETPHHAYGSVGYSAITSYAVPMSELFPLYLKPVTARHISSQINRAWERNGKPRSLKRDFIQAVIREWDDKEDSLVESLIDEFIGGQLKELGFTRAEWIDYCKHGDTPRFAFSPMVKEKIKRMGAQEVLRMYIEEPERLFQG